MNFLTRFLNFCTFLYSISHLTLTWIFSNIKSLLLVFICCFLGTGCVLKLGIHFLILALIDRPLILIPDATQGLLLTWHLTFKDHSWQWLGDYLECQESNLGWLFLCLICFDSQLLFSYFVHITAFICFELKDKILILFFHLLDIWFCHMIVILITMILHNNYFDWLQFHLPYNSMWRMLVILQLTLQLLWESFPCS